ncbi:MAG: MATE family efflux transporter [Bacteroidetes bacterium]|nr:MATE family efflux transporter [Bacteroidota bacterium]
MKPDTLTYKLHSSDVDIREMNLLERRNETSSQTAKINSGDHYGVRHVVSTFVRHFGSNHTRQTMEHPRKTVFLPSIGDHKKKILGLALPVVAGLSTQMVLSLIDTALVGRLPDAKYELAAMGIVFYLTWAIISFFSSLSTGTQVLVSRSYGSTNYKESGTILASSMTMAAALGLLAAAVVVIFSRNIAGFFAVDKRVACLAGQYLFFRFLGVPFFLISVAYRGFFFGIGKTKVFMFAGILSNILNIVLDYTLIFGAFGIRGMGLAGAGLGTSIAAGIETSVYLIVSTSKGYREEFGIFRNFRFHRSIGKSLIKISLPVSFESVFTLSGLLIYVSIIGLLGTLQQAASQTVLSALLLSYLPAMGFGVAAQSLVGRKLGEKDIQCARRWGFETSRIATSYTLLLGLIFISVPRFVLSMLTANADIIRVAVPILRIAGFAQIFFGVGFVLANGLQAAGESFFVMLADVTINWFVFVPLGYLFGVVLKLGITGVWAAMPFYTSLYALVIFAKFRYGKWKNVPQMKTTSYNTVLQERNHEVNKDIRKGHKALYSQVIFSLRSSCLSFVRLAVKCFNVGARLGHVKQKNGFRGNRSSRRTYSEVSK